MTTPKQQAEAVLALEKLATSGRWRVSNQGDVTEIRAVVDGHDICIVQNAWQEGPHSTMTGPWKDEYGDKANLDLIVALRNEGIAALRALLAENEADQKRKEAKEGGRMNDQNMNFGHNLLNDPCAGCGQEFQRPSDQRNVYEGKVYHVGCTPVVVTASERAQVREVAALREQLCSARAQVEELTAELVAVRAENKVLRAEMERDARTFNAQVEEYRKDAELAREVHAQQMLPAPPDEKVVQISKGTEGTGGG